MEILIAVAVIAILTSASIPAVYTFLPRYRLGAAVNELFSNLQRAKQEAVRANTECAIYFDDINDAYYIVAGGPDGICDGQPAGQPALAQNDDILLHQVSLSNYGSGIHFGSGASSKSVSGKAIPPVPTVTYNHRRVRFDSKGMVKEMGYAYLANINGAAFAVGTPSLAGAVVQKRWGGDDWN